MERTTGRQGSSSSSTPSSEKRLKAAKGGASSFWPSSIACTSASVCSTKLTANRVESPSPPTDSIIISSSPEASVSIMPKTEVSSRCSRVAAEAETKMPGWPTLSWTGR
nr:hypothetical protein [Thermaurantiacus tibetensis]